jgi:hypothetical protein
MHPDSLPWRGPHRSLIDSVRAQNVWPDTTVPSILIYGPHCRIELPVLTLTHGGKEMHLEFDLRLYTHGGPYLTLNQRVIELPPFRAGRFRLRSLGHERVLRANRWTEISGAGLSSSAAGLPSGPSRAGTPPLAQTPAAA